MLMANHQFPRAMRLRHQADFDRVHRGNAYAADGILVVRASCNDMTVSRLGVSLSRKAGNAVVRNRWKRLIREAFRLQQPALPTGLDLVVRPRRGATPNYAAVARSIRQLSDRVARRLRKVEP